jgi:hypothetical protein
VINQPCYNILQRQSMQRVIQLFHRCLGLS